MRFGFRIALAALSFTAAVAETGQDYAASITRWRAEREARLKADNGWLTVAGLHWLKEGDNAVGSGADVRIALPTAAPKLVGVITLQNGKTRFTPKGNVVYKGAPLTSPIDLRPDTEPNYDVLTVGRINFYVIKRDYKIGVRVKDNDNPPRKQFAGLQWYPVDPTWKVRAKFAPWDKPRKLYFDTEVGVKEEDESAGVVTFTRNGKEYKMEAVKDGDGLWFVMRDATSGKSTYAASRFLYTDAPKNGYVDIDFNRAENPPCAFTPYATCPLPPPQNRLTLAVTAGELYKH
ncbi:MAG: DUF1684 domain-containing protein [Bryobacteraceae bacterium]